MLNSEESSPSTWRFSMELLSHVHTLRVFLLPSSLQVLPARDCTNLKAALLSAPPALSCSWKATHEAAPHSLHLRLPVLLFDYSSPPHISALTDCIQVSLYLLPLPSLHLHAFSSLSLNCTGTPDISGVLGGANYAVFDVLDDRKGAQCGDEDIVHQISEKDATKESLCYQNNVVSGISFDDYTGQGPEHDCRHTTTLSINVGISGDVSYEVEGLHEAQQAEHCAHGDHYGCNNHVNIKKGIQDDDTHLGLECKHNGAHNEIGHNAKFTSTNHVSNKNGMSGIDTCEDVCKVCPHVIRPHGNGFNLEQSTHGSPLCFQCPEEKSDARRHLTQFNGGTVKASESSFLYPHIHVTNDCSSPHSQYDGLAKRNYSKEQGSEDHSSQEGTVTFVCKNCLAKVSRKPVRSIVQLPCYDWREVVENWFGACCCSFGSAAEVLSVSFEKSLQLWPGKCFVGPSTFYVDFSDVEVKEEPGISSNETSMRQLTTPCFLAFGNGFMVWENQQSKVVNWLPVRCTSCASLVGAYPHSTLSASPREGLHLFRCQVFTCNADGTFHDEYKFKTFKDLLVKELRLRTEENTTYRFLIRSLSSKLPLLQLVVLNYDTLVCTGKVNTDVVEHLECTNNMMNEVGLQQSLKVLFSECTGFSGDDVRSVELWVKEHDAETVFMLEEFVDKLRDELLANSMFCPTDCGLFQSFMGSFLPTLPA